jgi:hypothetical protein
MGWLPKAGLGVVEPPPWPMAVVRPLPRSEPPYFILFFSLAFRGGRATSKGQTPMVVKGVTQPPFFFSFHFYYFQFFKKVFNTFNFFFLKFYCFQFFINF